MSVRSRVNEYLHVPNPLSDEQRDAISSRNGLARACALGLAGAALLGAGAYSGAESPAVADSIVYSLDAFTACVLAVSVVSGAGAIVDHNKALRMASAVTES